MTRARHEHQIKRYLRTPYVASRIISAVKIFDRAYGLPWFTDEQIAGIRASLIEAQWSHYRFYRDQRRREA